MPNKQAITAVKDLNCFAVRTRRIRAWEDVHLPQCHSRTVFDLFILIATFCVARKELSLRTIFSSLDYSERGIRNALATLSEAGLCEVVDGEMDKRSKFVTSTKLGREKFLSYRALVLDEYSDFLGTFDPVI